MGVGGASEQLIDQCYQAWYGRHIAVPYTARGHTKPELRCAL